MINLFTFNSFNFDKKIFLSKTNKLDFESVWGTNNLILLENIALVQKGKSITKAKTLKGEIPVIAGGQNPAYFHNESNRDGNVITVSASGAYAGFVNYFDKPIFASDCNTINSKDENTFPTKLIFHILKSIQTDLYTLQRGQAQPHVYGNDIERIKIPLIPINKRKILLEEINQIELKSKTVVIKDINMAIKKIILKHIL